MKTFRLFWPPRGKHWQKVSKFPFFLYRHHLHCFALLIISSGLVRLPACQSARFCCSSLLSSHLKLSQNHFGIEWNIEIIPAGRWYHLSSLILDWIGMYNLLGIKTSKTVKSEWLAFSGAEWRQRGTRQPCSTLMSPLEVPPIKLVSGLSPGGGEGGHREDCGQS